MKLVSSTKQSIVWVHLADAHLCEKMTGWDAHRVLEPLRSDLSKMENDFDLHPDFIFFTGDLAYGNLPESSISDQFEEGRSFLDTVRTVFSPEIPPFNLFIVPGNHDVNFDEVAESETNWLDKLIEVQEEEAVRTINEMLRSANKQWQRFVERLSNYRSFLESAGYSHLLEDRERLVYSDIRTVAGIRVGIMGYNSAWSSHHGEEKGKLWLGDWQIGQLSRKLKDTVFNISLVHHPINWLNRYEDPRVMHEIERISRFLLHGHEHQGWVTEQKEHIRIATAACYDRSTAPVWKENGYNIVRLFPDDGTGEIFLRRYEKDDGGWVPRLIPHKTDKNGRWMLENLFWLKQISKPIARPPSDKGKFAVPTITPEYVKVAVLPFRYSTGGVLSDFLVDGFCDDIVSRLSRISELRVVSLESTLPLRDSTETATNIGRELGVDVLLTGSLREYQRKLRLHIHLIDLSSGTTLWAEGYDFTYEALVDTQTKVAKSVANELRVRLSAAEDASLTKQYTDSPEAYEFYLKGTGLLFKNTEQDLRLAISMFNQAIHFDKDFVDAAAGKAYALWKRYFQGWDATEDTLYEALGLAEKAVDRDSSSAMARMAIVRACWDLGWHERALAEGRKALDQNPNSIDALICMGRAYNNSGMADKAIPLVSKVLDVEPTNPAALKLLIFNYVMTKQYERACKTGQIYFKRNPGDSNTSWAVTMAYLHLRDFKGAIEAAHFGLKADPANYTLWLVLGYAYEASGDKEAAVKAWTSGIEATLDRLEGVKNNYRARAWLAALYAVAGKMREALQVITDIYEAKPENGYLLYRLANAYSALGMKEKALKMLRLAIKYGFLSVQMMRHEEAVTLRNLTKDPKYQKIAEDLERKVDALRDQY